jgi:hypothetical protein
MTKSTAHTDIATHLRGLTAAGIGYEVAGGDEPPATYDVAGRILRVRADLNRCEYGIIVCQVLIQEIRATGRA